MQWQLKVGDSVVVKEGVKDPDTGGSIGGYQGRVIDIGEDANGHTYVSVQWDSLTLKSIPLSSIEPMEEEGLDWAMFYLGIEDVEPAMERDTSAQVRRAIREIANPVRWVHWGAEGRRIQQVLAGIDREDTMAALKAWEHDLMKKLTFPFDAVISEYQESGYLQAGDPLSVRHIRGVDEHYGLLVELRRGRESYDFPLCDLAVRDENSPNYQPAQDYSVWFANR